MTPDEEDAFVKSCYVPCDKAQVGREIYDWKTLDEPAIRLAIRAAVAQERERAARLCFAQCVTARSFEGWESYNGACSDCAAAIRRGD